MNGQSEQRRFGFVMEQTLGHVTHYKNMRAAIDGDPTVAATWYPLAFAPRGTWETLPGLRTNWSARASWRARRLLSADHAATRFDALFFHTQVTTLLSTPLMRRVPTVISLDATPRNYDVVGAAYGHQRSSGLVEAVKEAANRRSLHAARALVTWCDWARESLIADYGVDAGRISVIAPGVDLAQWPAPRRSADGGPVRLLFVGADAERKGADVLLEAFAAGLAAGCELHLVTKSALEPRPGVHVYRDVTANSDVMKDLYATADVFVLPTKADCYPLVIQEAMAAGLPVVSTTVGAIGEAVRDCETGLLVPPGDVGALRNALLALAGDSTRRRAMGHAGRAHALERFNSVANAGRILALMRGLVQG